MSNTCFNTLVLTGPRPERERFVSELTAVAHYEALDVHAPVPNGRTGAEVWGTKGTKSEFSVSRTDTSIEVSVPTAWAPPYLWLEKAAVRFPTLRFELYFASVESAFGGYMLAAEGEVLSREGTTGGFADFFAQRGRPGFFIPYWEDEAVLEEEAREEALPSIAEIEEAEREELLSSLSEVGLR